jgi:endonuclease/exonuclease/phosphatase family metal-dependent hydrolase
MTSAPDRLRIATYNIFKANYLDRRGPLGATLRQDFELGILQEADVLAFQEAIVESEHPGSIVTGAATLAAPATSKSNGHRLDSIRELAPQLRSVVDATAHTRFHGSPHGEGRRWGVAMVSRVPARFEVIDLPRPFWSPWQRSAVLAQVGPWILGTMHLEVWPIGARGRRQQMKTVLEAVARLSEHPTAPAVLVGDFNCERGGPHEELRRAGFHPALAGRETTWSFRGLRLGLDHIYVRGATVLGAGVERRAGGSDHWPVWAELAL